MHLIFFSVVLVLLLGTRATAQQSSQPAGEPRRQGETLSKPSEAVSEVCIRAWLTTYLLFDVPLPRGARAGDASARLGGNGSGGLTGLFADEVMSMDDEESIKARALTKAIIKAPDNALLTQRITSYRSTTARREAGERMVRVAVAAQLTNLGTEPWTAAGGSLVAEGEELKGASVWQAEPIAPGATGLVVLEVETTESRARNIFTLEFWDESGTRRVTLRNVSFP